MDVLEQAVLLGVALLHLVPVVGWLGKPRLHALYGVTVEDPDTLVLLRHRALLLGLLGVVLAWGALEPLLRNGAVALGIVSMAGFVVLAGHNKGPMRRVFLSDVVALLALAVVVVLRITR